MSLFRLKKCCGFSLRTGTLILLWCSIFIAFFLLFVARADSFTQLNHKSRIIRILMLHNTISCLTSIIVSVIGLYGIYKKKSCVLIPYLGYKILSMVICWIIMIFIFINWSNIFNDEMLEKLIKDSEDSNRTDVKDDFENKKYFKMTLSSVIYYFVLLVFIIGTMLEIYAILIVYNYYKVMVEERREGGIFYSSSVGDDKINYPSSMQYNWNMNIPAYPPPYNELPVASCDYTGAKSTNPVV